MPEAGQSEVISKPFNPWLFWAGIVLLCGVVILASFFSHHLLEKKRWTEQPLPRFHHISQELTATERSGKAATLSSLNGKVRVFAYIYTVCPHGCAAIIGEMMKLNAAFGAHDDFFQVSVSVLPEQDTKAMMAAYAKGIGLNDESPWWFLTGERRPLWDFMTKSLKLEPAQPIPEDERLHPLDLYAHDLRIVLVDRAGHVRGYYAVFHPQAQIASLMCERLHQDVQRLLDDPSL